MTAVRFAHQNYGRPDGLEATKLNEPYVSYLPYDQRRPDPQFQRLLIDIKANGWWDECIQGEKLEDRGKAPVTTKKMIGAMLRYPMANGFPLFTERDELAAIERKSGDPWPSIFDQCVNECAAFLNGKHTQEGLVSYGVHWWHRWLTEKKCADFGLPPGEMGIGSYGQGWTNSPTHPNEAPYFGAPVNQIEKTYQQMREKPMLRTHVIQPWITPYTLYGQPQRKVVVAPCHGWLHFTFNTEKREMTLLHWQRSFDSLVGGMANIPQCAALGLATAKLLGYRFHELVYQISEPHYYSNQLDELKEILSREVRPFPTVHFNGEITDIREMRSSMFEVEDYHPNPAMYIPTPI